MPSRTLTVTLNSNHSKKFAFLLRSQEGIKNAILHEARNKFRIKSLSHVFLRGGVPLAERDADLGNAVTEVWVSKGEPYSGSLASELRTDRYTEVRVIAERSYVDEKAIKQLELISALPGVQLAVGMPDLHPGNRFPIGCAIASDGIYPALIGSDVGCGIALYRLRPPSRSALNPPKIASLLKGLDEPWSGSVANWLANYGIERRSPFDETSLGTVGAGNHFAEICAVERIVDKEAAERSDIQEGAAYLLVHTGSRGLGASVLASQTATESNPYISPDSPSLAAYLVEHDYAVQWAIANRDLLAHRIRRCLFPPDDDNAAGDINLWKILDVTHNSVTRHILNIGGEQKNLWVHRKGAAPSDKGVVPCPGSRGHFSWLLQPAGDGQYNAHSLAHGAGRRYARQALHNSGKYSKSNLRTTSLGSEVVCTDADLLLEERPEAYKDIESIIDDMEGKAICRGVAVLRPIVTYKVRQGAGERSQ